MKFNVGDKVRVVKGLKHGESIDGWDNCWIEAMDKTVGKEYEIGSYLDGGGYRLIGTSEYSIDYNYPEQFLKLAESPPTVEVAGKQLSPMECDIVSCYPSEIDNFYFDAEVNIRRSGDVFTFDIYSPDGEKMSLEFIITGRGHGKQMISRFLSSAYGGKK